MQPGSDAGQTTIEWLGLAAVVAALVMALAGVAPSLGQDVAAGYEAVICRVTGGTDCGTPPEEEEVCITRIARLEVTGGVTIMSVGPELTVATEKRVRSDGTVQVAMSADGSLGPEFIAGASLQVGNVEVETPGGDIDIEGSAATTLIYEFPDEAAADEFIEDVGQAATAITSNPVDALIGGGLDGVDIPPPNAVQITGGVGMEGSGSGTVIEGQGGGSVAAGLVHDLDNGHTTFILEVGGSVGGEFQPLADAAGGEISNTTQVRLEVDESGNPVAIELRNTLTGEVSGLITGTAAQSLIGDESVAGEVATALVGVEPSATAQVRTNAQVNLDDPQMGDAAGQLADAILSGDAARISDATATLGQEIYDNGEITADVYIGQEDSLTIIDGGIGIGPGFGLELGIAAANADLVASIVGRPGEGVQQRCDD